MIQIKKEELLESLKLGYLEYKECVCKGTDEIDLAYVKSFV